MIDAHNIELGELTDIRAGYPFRGAIADVRNGPVRVIQMKDVHPSGIIHWLGVIRTELSSRKAPDWLLAGDVLFVSRGARFYAASVESVPGPAVCSPHFFHLRLKPKPALLPRFLAWQINQAPLQRRLQSAAEGSSQLSIRRGELENLPIAVPALRDQEKIVQLAELALREKASLAALMRNRDKQLEALADVLARAHN